MSGAMLYDLLFYVIPAALVAFFGISLYRFLSAKKQNARSPGSFSPGEIKKRRIILIVSAVMAGALAVVVIGFILLLSMAVAFM